MTTEAIRRVNESSVEKEEGKLLIDQQSEQKGIRKGDRCLIPPSLLQQLRAFVDRHTR